MAVTYKYTNLFTNLQINQTIKQFVNWQQICTSVGVIPL